ncbi:hypothetical protein N2152v2_008579 [Parachlorella kessleri]
MGKEVPAELAWPPDGLDAPYPLTPQQVDFYKRNGFIRLKNVLSPETLAHYAKAIQAEVDKADHTPLEDEEAYASAFIQVINLWLLNQTCREFVFGKRLARLAAQLLEVDGVRVYHDQALFKSPGGGHTPWHCDQFYWPLSSDKTVTAWVPLVAVPPERGPLEFAAGSHKQDLGRSVGIGRESDKHVGAAVEQGGFEVVRGGFELGEVSFHSGWTFHRADENVSKEWRNVMTIIFMDKDMVMTEPCNENQRVDWERYLGGVSPGQVCAGIRNPLIWERGGVGI